MCAAQSAVFDSGCSTEHTTVAAARPVPAACRTSHRHRRERVVTAGKLRAGAGCVPSRPWRAATLYMATPGKWQLHHEISSESKYFPELIEIISVENFTGKDEDDNGLSMTAAAARDKDSFCWRPWHGCCALRGWSPPRPARHQRKAGGKAEDEGCKLLRPSLPLESPLEHSSVQFHP